MRTASFLLIALIASCASRQTARRAPATPALQSELEAVAVRIDGQVSITILELATGVETSVAGDVPVPLYSTFKAWIGVAVADAVERGRMRWTDTVRIQPDDLTFDYQPIAEAVGEGQDFTLEELVRWSIAWSDNPSADALLAHLGGANAVRDSLARLGLEEIVIRANEATLHEQAGEVRNEAASMSQGDLRRRMRERLAGGNQSTASAVARALSDLARREVLGEEGTERMLAELRATETGRNRLRAGLLEGWSIAHKTGTAHTIAGLGGAADMGIITAPDGARYAVAVFIVGSSAGRGEQEDLIADVARALVRSVE